MKYIPTEQEIIDYLYGEMSADDRKRMQQYLDKNPEKAEEIAGLNDTRVALGKYEDREVIAPDYPNEDSKSINTKTVPYWKSIMAVAASIALLILIGFITDLKISYKNAQLTVAFGEVKNEQPAVDQQLATLQKMVADLSKKQLQPEATDQLKTEIIDYMQAQQKSQNQMIDRRLAQFTKGGKEALDQYAQELKLSNATAINQYVANASLDQRAYLEDVLIDFTKYMEEQRIQDRKFYIDHLVDMKYESELKQQETEQLLSSIINKVNNINESETQNF